MTPALRWAAMRAILMFHYCEGQSHKTVSIDYNFWRERRAEANSNRGPSAYQPNALPLGQTGSLTECWWRCRAWCPPMSVDILGTNCDQCLSIKSTIALRPQKPSGSLGRKAQDGYLDFHTAPELWVRWQRQTYRGHVGGQTRGDKERP